MTNSDAIRYLDGLRKEITDTGAYAYDYLTMAIEALSCSEKPNKSDTIYRQDAIDAFRKDADMYPWDYSPYDAIVTIEDLPSAQSERKPVIRCWCPKCGFEMIPTIDSEMKGDEQL